MHPPLPLCQSVQVKPPAVPDPSEHSCVPPVKAGPLQAASEVEPEEPELDPEAAPEAAPVLAPEAPPELDPVVAPELAPPEPELEPDEPLPPSEFVVEGPSTEEPHAARMAVTVRR